jgi:3-phenylpropionate/cinnamic acid dioxygenase small subunit
MENLMSIQDRADVADLLARLALTLDERRFDDLRALYAPDAHVTSPRGELRGIDEIVDVVGGSSPAGVRTQHVNATIVIDVDGDRADVRSQQLVYYFHDGAAPHRTSSIDARYVAERRPQGWRLVRGRIAPLWQNPTPTD